MSTVVESQSESAKIPQKTGMKKNGIMPSMKVFPSFMR